MRTGGPKKNCVGASLTMESSDAGGSVGSNDGDGGASSVAGSSDDDAGSP